MNVKAVDGMPSRVDDFEGNCNFAKISPCVGSRREASISERLGAEVGIDGGGGGGAEVDVEASASHADFSSSRLCLR